MLRARRTADRTEIDELRAVQNIARRVVQREAWEQVEYTPSEIIVALKGAFDVPYHDAEAKALLSEYGFNPDNVLEEAAVRGQRASGVAWRVPLGVYFPMAYFASVGDLQMCKWLFSHGGVDDIRRTRNGGISPMFMACDGGHLSVCK